MRTKETQSAARRASLHSSRSSATRGTRSSRFLTVREGVRGRAGAILVAGASLTTSPVKPVARFTVGVAPRAWARASLYATLRVVAGRDSYSRYQNARVRSGSQPDSAIRRRMFTPARVMDLAAPSA